MASIVLDASAVLAALRRERGGAEVAALLVAARADIFISSVNYAEVVSKLVKDGASQEQVEVLLGPLKGRVLPFTQNQAELCGLLIRETGAFGLSLGDRACLSLAKELGAVAWTADRAWAKLAGAIEIEVIRGEDENAS